MKRKKIEVTIAAWMAGAIISWGQGFAAERYYVSPAGSNSNPGTREKPWASPGYGSRRLQPGDTLVLLDGTYTLKTYDDDIITPPSGREDAWVTIQGEDGARPVLAGRDNLLTAVDLSGKSYVRLENLEITHDSSASGASRFFRDGIEILERPASHIVLRDLLIHHIDEMGMNIGDVDDLLIENCRIEHCGFGALAGPLGRQGGWRNVVIRNCRLSYSGHYYQGGDGSNRPYDRPDGFGIEPSAGPILIEDTIAEHNCGDGLDSKAERTVIRRCIVANNSCDGVKLWGTGSRLENTLIFGRGDGRNEATPWAAVVIDQVERKDATFEIVNCTVDDEVGRNYLMYVQYSSSVPVQLTVVNTIFSGRGQDSQENLLYEKLSAHIPRIGLPSRFAIACGGATDADGRPADTTERFDAEYLAEIAGASNLAARICSIEQIGWDLDAQRFTDDRDEPLEAMIKIYPWDWMEDEPNAEVLPSSRTRIYPGAWVRLLADKTMMALLWHMFPDGENLLPTFLDRPPRGEWVAKPRRGWDGEHVYLPGQPVGAVPEDEVGPLLFQAHCPLPVFPAARGQAHAAVSVWMVGGEPAGLSFRESRGPVTGPAARFVPHILRG